MRGLAVIDKRNRGARRDGNGGRTKTRISHRDRHGAGGGAAGWAGTGNRGHRWRGFGRRRIADRFNDALAAIHIPPGHQNYDNDG